MPWLIKTNKYIFNPTCLYIMECIANSFDDGAQWGKSASRGLFRTYAKKLKMF